MAQLRTITPDYYPKLLQELAEWISVYNGDSLLIPEAKFLELIQLDDITVQGSGQALSQLMHAWQDTYPPLIDRKSFGNYVLLALNEHTPNILGPRGYSKDSSLTARPASQETLYVLKRMAEFLTGASSPEDSDFSIKAQAPKQEIRITEKQPR
ncbi:MAG TPA: hypothetical protein PKI93_06590 [Alphaproteobacteria bacterium]|nr:hypothetical protein [Alphaproteobacteria bacterium]HNS44738.1 hypothetical protein [Alphaproteobacteria bacterium]